MICAWPSSLTCGGSKNGHGFCNMVERLHPREDQMIVPAQTPSICSQNTVLLRWTYAKWFALVAFLLQCFYARRPDGIRWCQHVKSHMHRKSAPGLFVFGLRFCPSSRREGSYGLSVPADIIHQLSESQACQHQSKEALQPFNTHQTCLCARAFKRWQLNAAFLSL